MSSRYSFSGICISESRQALIFSRRQTQHNPSDSSEALLSPQTRHSTFFWFGAWKT